jgi:hypothetical protein
VAAYSWRGRLCRIEFTWSKNRVGDAVFAWRHIQENVLEWARETKSEEPLLMTLARILGILTWDATVRLARVRQPEVIQLYRRAGWHFLNASQLRWKKVRLGLEPATLAALREEWAGVIQNPWETVPFGVVNEVVTLATDATPFLLAGLRLSPAPTMAWQFPPTWPDGSINNMEAEACLRTLMNAAEGFTHAFIVIAVDNAAAVSWVNGRGCPHQGIQNLVDQANLVMKRRKSRFLAVWIPPSRQRDPSVEQMEACARRLEAVANTFAVRAKFCPVGKRQRAELDEE